MVRKEAGECEPGGRSSLRVQPAGAKQQLGAGWVRGAEVTSSDRDRGNRCPIIANFRLFSEHDQISLSAFNSEA